MTPVTGCPRSGRRPRCRRRRGSCSAEDGPRDQEVERRALRRARRGSPPWTRMRPMSGGSTPASRIGSLCGQPPPIGSLSGPSSIIWTKSRTTKLRRSVVTTSSAPSLQLEQRRHEHQEGAGERRRQQDRSGRAMAGGASMAPAADRNRGERAHIELALARRHCRAARGTRSLRQGR